MSSPFFQLSSDEVQLVMAALDRRSLLALARSSRGLCNDAAHVGAWRNASIEVRLDKETDIPALKHRIACSLVRYAPLTALQILDGFDTDEQVVAVADAVLSLPALVSLEQKNAGGMLMDEKQWNRILGGTEASTAQLESIAFDLPLCLPPGFVRTLAASAPKLHTIRLLRKLHATVNLHGIESLHSLRTLQFVDSYEAPMMTQVAKSNSITELMVNGPTIAGGWLGRIIEQGAKTGCIAESLRKVTLRYIGPSWSTPEEWSNLALLFSNVEELTLRLLHNFPSLLPLLPRMPKLRRLRWTFLGGNPEEEADPKIILAMLETNPNLSLELLEERQERPADDVEYWQEEEEWRPAYAALAELAKTQSRFVHTIKTVKDQSTCEGYEIEM